VEDSPLERVVCGAQDLHILSAHEAKLASPVPIKILSVDDHPLVRDGINFAIQSQPDMTVVAEASNGREAVEMFLSHRPDVTLMDLQMPVMGGIEATVEIRRAAPSARVLVLTTYSGDIQATRAMEAGAAGYLLKGSLRKELVQAIRDVHGGRRRIQPEVANEMPKTSAQTGFQRARSRCCASWQLASPIRLLPIPCVSLRTPSRDT
jgi:DNA-binding NarL/FixJ family response regulator